MEDRIRASETDNNFIERLVAPVTRFKDVQTRVVVVVVASMELKFKLQTIDGPTPKDPRRFTSFHDHIYMIFVLSIKINLSFRFRELIRNL